MAAAAAALQKGHMITFKQENCGDTIAGLQDRITLSAVAL
jgi:hypothetical protein